MNQPVVYTVIKRTEPDEDLSPDGQRNMDECPEGQGAGLL